MAAVFFYAKSILSPWRRLSDPATAIHINASGDITDSSVVSSITNIHRDGNLYTLTGNLTNWVIIEKSNIVLDGMGFSFIGSNGLSLTKVSNVTVKDLHLETHYLRIVLQNTKNCIVQNVTSNFGFDLSGSDNNLISNCTGDVSLENSDGNTVKNCATGEIELSKSNGNSIFYNDISTQGPSLGFQDSSNNLVFGNTFWKFWWWIGMWGDSNHNTIVANDIRAGGLYLVNSLVGTNYIYHNNFWNFKWNQTATTNSINIWSTNMQGNYWGNYNGSDLNHDGVGDTPYLIDTTNTDNYPLMTPVNLSAELLPQYRQIV